MPWAHTSRLPSSVAPSVVSDISKSAVINCPHFTRRFEKKEEKAERETGRESADGDQGQQREEG